VVNNAKIAMGQMLVESGRPEQNLSRAVDMIRQAGTQECDFIVLPECLDLGWANPDAARYATPIPGKYSDILSKEAKKAGIYVVAGLSERDGSHVYNTAVLVSANGELLLKHRKINELTIVHDIYSIGDRLGVAETPFGIVGINICADNLPGSLAIGHTLCRMGARLILSPCAWAVRPGYDNTQQTYGDIWRKSYRTLASVYETAVVGVSSVGVLKNGPWKDWDCIGCSLAVGSDQTIVTQGKFGREAEQLLIAEIEVRVAQAKGTEWDKLLSEK
jgi:predicted amidohydrolase